MPNNALGIGSGFLQGFESVIGPHLERQAQQRAHQSMVEEVQMHKEVRKKIGELSATEEGRKVLAEHPEYLEQGMAAMPGVNSHPLLSGIFGGKKSGKFDPEIALKLITTPDPTQERLGQEFFGNAPAAAAPAAPNAPAAAAPNATPTTAPAPAAPARLAPADAQAFIPKEHRLAIAYRGGKFVATKPAETNAGRRTDEVADILNTTHGAPEDVPLDEAFMSASQGHHPDAVRQAGEAHSDAIYGQLLKQGMSRPDAAKAIMESPLAPFASKEIQKEFAPTLAAEREKNVQAVRGPAMAQQQMQRENIRATMNPSQYQQHVRALKEAGVDNPTQEQIDAFALGRSNQKETTKAQAKYDVEKLGKPLTAQDRQNMYTPDGRRVTSQVSTLGEAKDVGAVTLSKDDQKGVTNVKKMLNILQRYREASDKIITSDDPKTNAINYASETLKGERAVFDQFHGQLQPFMLFLGDQRLSHSHDSFVRSEKNLPGLSNPYVTKTDRDKVLNDLESSVAGYLDGLGLDAKQIIGTATHRAPAEPATVQPGHDLGDGVTVESIE